MHPDIEKAIEYIKNTGNDFIDVRIFDDDWEPIGPLLRYHLCDLKLAREERGVLFLRMDNSK